MRCKAALLAVLLLAGACRRHSAESRFQRLAVLTFENLTGDRAYEWWCPALADLMTEAAAGLAAVHALRAESPWDAPSLRATHVLHGFLTRQGPGLRLEAALEDLTRRAVRRRHVIEGPPGEGPARFADRLAAELGLRARPVAVRKSPALEAYAGALRSPNPVPLLERAVASDSGFLAPYLLLAGLHLARGHRDSALAVLDRSLSADLDPIARHRAELALAGIRGDRAAQERALENLARLTPADPEVRQGLAAHSLARRDYAGAARAYREAIERDPDNAMLLNQAAYGLSYGGHFEEALRLLLRYRQLRPADPNPPDSLGDVRFQMGDFAGAAGSYLESIKISPVFADGGALYKAAWARRLQGDSEGADRHMAEFLAQRERARDPLLELRRAHWEYLTGRSRQATARLLAFAESLPPGELRALAHGFLAAWSLEADDRRQARGHAAQASLAETPQARELARICTFLAQDAASPQDWARRAATSFPQPADAGLRDTALAYALLLGGYFREALPLLRDLLERTPPTPAEVLPVLAAWAANASGQDVRPWLTRWPVPAASLPQPFDCLAWPRVVYLKATMAETSGARERSASLYGVFLQMVGDRPGHVKEQERARIATRAK